LEKTIQYPRKAFTRNLLRLIGKLILPLFADIKISGKENFPQKGATILAGNHAAVIEAVLMAVYSPRIVEFLGTGDIPIDPRYAWLTNLYGFIPVMRGSVDRAAIYKTLDVLKQGGVVGIFPQGGIWGAAVNQGRAGVALLGVMSGAPIVPIGFGGVRGGVEKMVKLLRPQLTINVGKPFRLSHENGKESNSKARLQRDVNLVMEAIEQLIPTEEIEKNNRRGEYFGIEVEVYRLERSLPLRLSETDTLALGMFFHFPVLLDALARNVKLPVACLQRFGEKLPAAELRAALNAILEYLENVNPGFFTYRFGVDVGLKIEQALSTLQTILPESSEIVLTPIYGYTETNGETIEIRGKNSLHPV
jgi:1-acyl-sn-glycerol-3-phosphate acyltransferase